MRNSFRRKNCQHNWKHLQDKEIVYSELGSSETTCWIYCSKCKEEDLVFKDQWLRISKIQEDTHE